MTNYKTKVFYKTKEQCRIPEDEAAYADDMAVMLSFMDDLKNGIQEVDVTAYPNDYAAGRVTGMLIDKYGIERTAYMFAGMVRAARMGERFTYRNLAWADSVKGCADDDKLTVLSTACINPLWLDDMCRHVREADLKNRAKEQEKWQT